MAQAIPAMATQGGDPASIVTKIAGVITARQKGQSLEDAIADDICSYSNSSSCWGGNFSC
jgi:hypothetical protein